MAQHDVYRTEDGSYLLDCQSDFLDNLNTRFVIPLIDPDKAPDSVRGLNPSFEIRGKTLVLYTQFASTVPEDVLAQRIASLSDERITIMNAIDTLVGSY